MTCIKCGKDNDSANYKNMSNAAMCFSCNYWHDALLESNKLIINGCIYFDCGWADKSQGFLGFGGRVFTYRKLDSDEVVVTNNLWNGSKIPEIWRIPDNAEFIQSKT